jgi:hypothetical protein
MKSNAFLNAVALVFAGIVGMLTGTAIEALPLAQALVISSLVGLTAGAVLFVVLKLVLGRKAQ